MSLRTEQTAAAGRAAARRMGRDALLKALRGAQGAAPARVVGLVFPRLSAASLGLRGAKGEPFARTSIPGHAATLRTCAEQVRPKGAGRVLVYGKSRNGGCGDEDAAAVTALLLDCDEAGDWGALLTVLEETGTAHVAYRTGGHTDARPRWRCVLPLAAEVPAPPKAQYESEYGHLQGVFSELAGLDARGFDPSTDRLLQVIYPPVRYTETAPVREVRHLDGKPLDWRRLLDVTAYAPLPALPPVGQVGVGAWVEPRRFTLLDLEEALLRAIRFLENPRTPVSRSGSRGDDTAFAVAQALTLGFPLADPGRIMAEADAGLTAHHLRAEEVERVGLELLEGIWNPRCVAEDGVTPYPWPMSTLRRKVREAMRGHLNGKPRWWHFDCPRWREKWSAEQAALRRVEQSSKRREPRPGQVEAL